MTERPTVPQIRRVRHVCPGGNRCCLRDEPSHPGARHTLCICSDPACACHSQARYEAKARADAEATD